MAICDIQRPRDFVPIDLMRCVSRPQQLPTMESFYRLEVQLLENGVKEFGYGTISGHGPIPSETGHVDRYAGMLVGSVLVKQE
jgi:hypothetical protein